MREAIPPGPLLFHASPRVHRDSIRLHGLRIDADRTGMGAVFLSSLPSDAGRAVLDCWQVDATGLLLEPDTTADRDEPTSERDPWFACYEAIDAERLMLLNAA